MDSSVLSPSDFKKYFATNNTLSALHGEFLLNGPIAQAGIMVLHRPHIFGAYITKKHEKKCMEKGLTFYSNQEKFNTYIKKFQKYVDDANKLIIPKYKTIPKNLKKEELDKDIGFIAKLWAYYGLAEFVFTDLAYTKGSAQAKKNAYAINKFKFKAREVMNAYFFKNGVIDNVLNYCSQQFLKENDAHYLYKDELLDLFDGKKPDHKIINERKKAHGSIVIEGNIKRLSSSQSLELSKRLVFCEKEEIQGISINSGKVIGRAIIAPMYNDYKSIAEINKRMMQGDILIAESTSPDIMMLCEKASAIVAEQGGLLSHAAILSRELNIPGIVQATFATQIFKDHDLKKLMKTRGL